jgi:hypothetical protein
MSDELICTWRGPCSIDSFSGVDCGAPVLAEEEMVVKTEILMSIEMVDPDAFFGNKTSLDKWTKSISLAMAGDLTLWSHIKIVPPIASSTRRQLAATEMQVIIYSADTATAADRAAVLEDPGFTDVLKTKLADHGAAGATSLTFDTSTIKTEDSITIYTLPIYPQSAVIKILRQYSLNPEETKWDMWDKEYQKGVAGVMTACLLFGFWLISMYWFFMCCHNVHWLCGKGPLPFHLCNFCSNKKSWGSLRDGKIILCVYYGIVFITAMSAWSGRNHFQAAVGDMAEALEEMATVFDTLASSGSEFEAEAVEFKAIVAIENVCTNPDTTTSLEDISDSFSTAAGTLNGMFDGLGPKARDMSAQMNGWGASLVDGAIAAITLLFLITSVSGIASTLLGSRTALGAANGFGVVVLIFMTVFVAIELTVAVGFADFCSLGSGPHFNLVAIANHTMGEGPNLDIFAYYATCIGEGPAAEAVGQARDFGSILAMQTKGLGRSYGGAASQCDSDEMLKVWSPTTGIGQDVQVSVANIAKGIDCSTITPILVKMTHGAVCDKMVSGIYSLWTAQVTASFFLLYSLFYAAFVREHFQDSQYPLICGGENPNDATKSTKVYVAEQDTTGEEKNGTFKDPPADDVSTVEPMPSSAPGRNQLVDR